MLLPKFEAKFHGIKKNVNYFFLKYQVKGILISTYTFCSIVHFISSISQKKKPFQPMQDADSFVVVIVVEEKVLPHGNINIH